MVEAAFQAVRSTEIRLHAWASGQTRDSAATAEAARFSGRPQHWFKFAPTPGLPRPGRPRRSRAL